LGLDVQLQVSVSPVRSPKGLQNKVVFVNDFTEIAKSQRVAAWRDVARKIAHEIKNPLTPIRLGAQRLDRKFRERFRETQDEEAFRESIEVIEHSVESIKSLVDSFLQFSRMPTAKLSLGSLNEAVRIAVAAFKESPETVGVLFEPEAQNNDKVTFDRDQIIRLCSNLIANALSASQGCTDQPVQVKVCVNPILGFAQIEVKDNGAGVPKRLRDKIFEPYFSTKRSGMGLGLVIVQQIASEHNGRLSLEQNNPQGTVVLFEFPMGEI
jgi:two-component system, NtrC family, nitrogen regulation sensor histidine kinase NtrY